MAIMAPIWQQSPVAIFFLIISKSYLLKLQFDTMTPRAHLFLGNFEQFGAILPGRRGNLAL
jgi:hypothetical protein